MVIVAPNERGTLVDSSRLFLLSIIVQQHSKRYYKKSQTQLQPKLKTQFRIKFTFIGDKKADRTFQVLSQVGYIRHLSIINLSQHKNKQVI